MQKKRNTIDTLNLSEVEVYLLVRSGKITRFPNGFLDKSTCKEILRWLCLDYYHMNRESICRIDSSFLFCNFLSSFRKVFGNNMYHLICYTFPELNIKEWETLKVQNNFWHDKGHQKEFVEWIAEKEQLDLKNIDDVSKITAEMIAHYGGSKARKIAGGTYELVSTATGSRFQEWELFKMDIWTEEKAVKAVKWLIEDKLKWSDEQVKSSLTASVFYRNDLGGMLKHYCGNSPIKALEIAYPGKFTSLKHSKM